MKGRVEPKYVAFLTAALRPTAEGPVLVVAPYLRPRTQELLRDVGFSYADVTGHARLELTEPGLFIDTTGARTNPDPSPRDQKSRSE